MGTKGSQRKSRERKDASLWVGKGGVSGGTGSTGDTEHMVGSQMDLELKGSGVMGLRASASPGWGSGSGAKPGMLAMCLCSFLSILQETVMLLVPECDVSFIPSVDGGGRGVAMVTAVAARLAAHRRLLEETLAPFRLNREQLAAVQAQMQEAMAKGLQGEASSLRMLPTYVRATPDGSGEDLA